MPEPIPALRVDPRIEQSRRTICAAALLEFAEFGFDGMTIEGVAARAGVGKSTIYRQWRCREDLIEDSMQTMPAGAEAAGDPELGVHTRVRAYLRRIEETIGASEWAKVLPALVHASEQSADMAQAQNRFSADRMASLRTILQTGIDRGELAESSDTEVMASAMVGALFFNRLIRHERTSAEEIDRLVGQVLGVPTAP